MSSVWANLSATFSDLGLNKPLARLNYFHIAQGFGAPEISLNGLNEGDWQFVNGAYETVIVLPGPLPVIQLVMDLETVTFGGRADYYHTAALSIELPPGVTFTSASGVLLTRPDFENDTPVADAGPDQTVTAGAGCVAPVTLDGTGADDPDDDPLTFTWSSPFGTASGPTPTVSLPVGTHTITLTVDDGTNGPAEDTVTVVVMPGGAGTEVCNGQDDDCDGFMDTSPTGTPVSCDDGNACTTNDTCSLPGLCAGNVPLSCDDGNACTTDSCDSTSGCVYTPVAAGTSIGSCITGLPGVCSAGVQICTGDGTAVCQQTTHSSPEVCGDGLDNDCNGAVDNSCAVACATNVSSQVTVTRGGFRLNRTTGRYVQTVTVQNTGGSAIAGPVALVLDTLSSTATLVNRSGYTTCATPVSPYLTVNVGPDTTLSSGESVSVTLEFTTSSNASITYTPRVLAGTPQ